MPPDTKLDHPDHGGLPNGESTLQRIRRVDVPDKNQKPRSGLFRRAMKNEVSRIFTVSEEVNKTASYTHLSKFGGHKKTAQPVKS